MSARGETGNDVSAAADQQWLFEEAMRLLRERDIRDAQTLFEVLAGEAGPYQAAARDRLRDLPAMPVLAHAPQPPADIETRRDLAPFRSSVPGFETAVPAGSEVRRTPHLDVPAQPIAPGTEFEVTVRVDTGDPDPEALADPIVFNGASAALRIYLRTSDHFEVGGEPVRELVVRSDLDSQAASPFQVRVRAAARLEGLGAPVIAAAFFLEGRPCGRVSRPVALEGVPAGPTVPAPSATLRADIDADPADLSVTITAALANDGRQFHCVVHSPLLEALRNGKEGPWNLPDVTQVIVKRHMDRFTTPNLSARQRVAALRGAGKDFFKASPPVFQAASWQLVDSGHRPAHIAIVSDEPHMPWELMVPTRMTADDVASEDALGVQCAVGRWVGHDGIAPPQIIRLRSTSIVVPNYPAHRALKHAAVEAAHILHEFPGSESLAPVTFDSLEGFIRDSLHDILHFACHGTDRLGAQALELEKDTLTPSELSAMDGVDRAFFRVRPLVFLNACETGRGAPALVGASGFAKTFADLGASGVVAALWSVKDDLAHEIALAFYSRLKDRSSVSFAEILRDVRKEAYDYATGEDTYAAYCFYGDPRARAVF